MSAAAALVVDDAASDIATKGKAKATAEPAAARHTSETMDALMASDEKVVLGVLRRYKMATFNTTGAPLDATDKTAVEPSKCSGITTSGAVIVGSAALGALLLGCILALALRGLWLRRKSGAVSSKMAPIQHVATDHVRVTVVGHDASTLTAA